MTDPAAPPDPHPATPEGGRLSCATGRPCRLVAECHFGCCRKVACDDCGAEFWVMRDLAPLEVPRARE